MFYKRMVHSFFTFSLWLFGLTNFHGFVLSYKNVTEILNNELLALCCVSELDLRVGSLFRDEVAVKNFFVTNSYLSQEAADTLLGATINIVEVFIEKRNETFDKQMAKNVLFS